MKKILKIIGITLLLISMGYASNWDLPKETRADKLAGLEEELREYEALLKGDPEPTGWELWGGPLPEEVIND